MPLQVNRKALVILVLVALALAAGALAVGSWVLVDKQTRAKQFLEEARASAAAGENERAIIQYKNVLAYDSENISAYIELADLYVKTGDLNQAYRYYNMGSTKDPRNVEALSKLLECYHIAGQWDDVKPTAARVISLSPGGNAEAQAHHYLAQAYYTEKEYEKAADEFRKALEFDSSNLDALLALGLIQSQHLRQQAEAEVTLKTLLDKAGDESAESSDRAEAAVRAAKFYAATGRNVEAEDLYKMAIELEGGRPRYWLALGDFYRHAGRDEQHLSLAEAAYLKALEGGPGDGSAYLSLGLFYAETGRTDRVVETFERGIAAPGTAAFHQLYYQHLIEALLAKSDIDGARRRLSDLRMEKNTQDVADYLEGRIYLARAAGVDENLLKAQRLFADVAKARPRFPHARYYLGLCLATRGMLDDAKLEFQRAQAIAGDFPEASVALGETYLRTRDFDKALLAVQPVLAMKPQDFRANLIAGRCQLALGNPGAAASFLKQAVDAQPSSVEPYIALADLHSAQGEHEKAIEVLEEAVKVTEDPDRARMALALMYYAAGDRDKALEIASALAAASPSDAGAANFYASLLWRADRSEDAFDFIGKRVERYGDNVEYLNILGNLQRSLGRHEEALATYTKTLAASPANRDALAGAAESLVALGEFARAREMLSRLEQADPGSPTSDLLEARILRSEGKNDAAAALLSNTVRQNPSLAEAHYLLALIQEERGEISRAIESLKASLKHNPSSVTARLALAELYYRTRYFDDALREARLVVNRSELDPQTLRRAVGITAGSLVEHKRVSDAIDEWLSLPSEVASSGDYALKLGYLYLLNNEYDEAQESFIRAGESADNAAAAMEGLAQVMLARGRLDEALAQANKALAMDCDDATRVRLLNVVAAVAMKNDDRETALRAVQESVKAAGSDADLLLQAADFLLSLGEREQAIETYRKAVSLPGSPTEAKRRLVLALADAGHHAEALSLADDILRADPNGFDALVLKSQALLAQGNLAEAAELLERALAEPILDAKASAAARYLLAEAYYRSGVLAAAETQLRRALTQDSTLMQARLLLAEVQLRSGAYEQAAVTARDVIAAEPENERAYGVLGDATKLSGNYEAAISYYRKVLSMSRNKAAFIALVQALKTQGKDDENIAEMEKFFQRDTSDADVAWMLAREYEGKQDYQRAEAVLKTAIEAGGDRRKLDGPLAIVYRRQGRFDEAEHVLLQAIERSPAPDAYRALAALYDIAGRRGDAEATFRKAIGLYPAFLPNYTDLAALLAQDGKFEKGLEVLRQGLSANPDMEPFYQAAAGFLIDGNRASEAEEFIRSTLSEKPRFAELSCMLADLYFLRGESDRALEQYEQALKMAQGPSVARAANGVAYILAEKGVDLNRAIELATAANVSRPEDPGILDTLGWAHYRAGQYNKAVVNLARAAELTGDKSAETLYHLSLAYSKAGMVANAKETAQRLVAVDASWSQQQDIKDILAQE